MKVKLLIKFLESKITISALLILLSAFSLNAQQVSIKGQVTDENGAPIPGANVIVKETSDGTITNVSGEYEIVAGSNSTLVFSFIGYESKEVTVGDQTVINVILIEQSTALDELVVVGYGEKRKRDLTGSIASVNMDDIEKTPVKDVLSAMQGRVSGVNIVSQSGAPGAGIQVQVRGLSTLNSGNTPLYIVDGVQLESNSLTLNNRYDIHGLNPLADINPQDIQSIEILKDASSTAIYGSRGANGVVIITTKRGDAGKAKVNVNLSAGMSKITRKLPVLNATQWRELITDSYLNRGYDRSAIHWTVADSLNPMVNQDINWQELLYQTAYQKQANVSVTGGNEDMVYAFSTSILDQDGIVLNTGFKRYSSRLNMDFQVTKKLKVGQSFAFSHSLTDRIESGGENNTGFVQSVLTRPPVYALEYPDGSDIGFFTGKINLQLYCTDVTNKATSNRFTGLQYAELEIIDGLKLRTNLSVDYIGLKEDYFLPSYLYSKSLGAVYTTNNTIWSSETFLSFNKSINDHTFTAMAGFSLQEWLKDKFGLNGESYTSNNITTINGATVIKEYNNTTYNGISRHRMRSYFGRVGYDYKQKYLLEATLRADGSSRFGLNQQYGIFPSVSGAWRFSAEDFLSGLSILNDGKIRASYGVTGNEAIGDYAWQGEFALGTNYVSNAGASPTMPSNYQLGWESTTQYDIGMDLSFLNNRVMLVADYYKKLTSNLLFNVTLPDYIGYSYVTRNLGEISNEGFEFSINTHNVKSQDFNWHSSMNISTNKNVIVDLPDDLLTDGMMSNGYFHILQEGQPIGTFYGYKFEGVYAYDEDNTTGLTEANSGLVFAGGDPIYDDLVNDNVIDASDRQIIGNAHPLFVGGFNNDFTYKGFTLNVFFQYVYGNDIYSDLNRARNWVFYYNNVSADALNRWREQGDVTNYPRPLRGDPLRNEYWRDGRVTSRWVEDGSYIKLKNVSLSYRLPSTITEKLKCSAISVYLTGSNLITWTHYDAYDPDVSSLNGTQIGVDYGSFPQSRSYIFGINVDF